MDALPAATGEELAIARRELASLDIPDGVGSDAWQQLCDALLDSMQNRSTSKLPNESRNVIDDLQWIDNGGGDFSLEWTFRNAGDYDNNGEVNVSDLSAIGVHFGKNESSSSWASAQTADGDGNGEINIADVSPIGVNFGSQVLGYNVYASDYEDGPWLLQGSIPLEDATSGFPRKFSYAYGAQAHAFVSVAPFDNSGNDTVAASGGTAAKYIPGEVTMGDSAVVDLENGAVLEGDAGTPLEGVSVLIPEGAMPTATSIAIGYNDGIVIPVAGNWSGTIIEIGDEPLVFDVPVEITVPYSGNPDEVPVPYYINDDSKLEACMVQEVNGSEGTMTFITLHASRFTWIISVGLPEKVNTEFKPSKDGFQIANWGSLYERNGECLGMATFASWYYAKKRAGETSSDLYPSFMYALGSDYLTAPSGEVINVNITGQDAIATRAHSALNSLWYRYGAVYARNPGNELHILHQICNSMANTNTPTPLYLAYSGINPALYFNGDHCVLAYAYDDGVISVYNPNLPPFEEEITYNGLDFDMYEDKYNVVYNLGMGSYMKESFGNILDDAQNMFSGTLIAEVAEVNYQNGAVVDVPEIVLQGEVQSSQLLVERIKFDTGLFVVEKAVNVDTGKWSARIPLQSGDNFIKIITEARNQDGNWFVIPNNFDLTHGLHLICEAPSAKMRITLTWDQENRFGLEVTDPTGDVASSASSHGNAGITTDDGGRIDGSYFNGGPLSFIIGENDTIRNGEEYRIRVLNNSSSATYDQIPTKWTLAVSANDGPPVYYSGILTKGTNQYVDPDDFGAYWSKYIDITP
ncbi:hypothetical protein KDL30_02570 [bacterium]|nr:hypothetical protein [bacterium]